MKKNFPRLTIAYFSPTGNTKTICSRFAYTLNWSVEPQRDLTDIQERQREWSPQPDTVCVIGAPVYAGRIPVQVLQFLSFTQGNGNWAIPLVVNGNVRSGNSLYELATLLRLRGFRILAAASFVGKHSFCHEGFPLGEGRPDAADMQMVEDFARKIENKIQGTPTELDFPAVGPNYSEPHPQYKAQNMSDPPARNPATCVECKECWAHCPVSAIDFETLEVHNDTCIRCFSCVQICKWNSRAIVLHLSPEAKTRFDACLSARVEPEFFL